MMEPAELSGYEMHNLGCSVQNVSDLAHEDVVPEMDLSKQAESGKEAMSSTMPTGILEIGEEEASSKSNCCSDTRLCEKMTPKNGWRKRICKTLLATMLAVIIVSACTLPTTIYFSSLVNA